MITFAWCPQCGKPRSMVCQIWPRHYSSRRGRRGGGEEAEDGDEEEGSEDNEALYGIPGSSERAPFSLERVGNGHGIACMPLMKCHKKRYHNRRKRKEKSAGAIGFTSTTVDPVTGQLFCKARRQHGERVSLQFLNIFGRMVFVRTHRRSAVYKICPLCGVQMELDSLLCRLLPGLGFVCLLCSQAVGRSS